MAEPDLFETEAATLKLARKILESDALHAAAYRHALQDLARNYERMLREMRSLIRRSDRAEREMNELNAQLQHLTEQLDHKARHDALTGALNRGAIFEYARQHLQDGSLSLIVLDIDLFKRINDQFGHPAGDAVLIELASRISLSVSDAGQTGRVGGEEFLVVLPHTTIEQACRVAETLRCTIASERFASLPQHPVTASFGVSHGGMGSCIEDIYAQADQALYQAKNGGRNRVVTYQKACA